MICGLGGGIVKRFNPLYYFSFVEKTITKTMLCLANKNQMHVPTTTEKLTLLENGLGEKRISFPVSAMDAAVKDILFWYVLIIF
jgi:hypothetical protein